LHSEIVGVRLGLPPSFPSAFSSFVFFAGGLRLFICYIFKEYMLHKGDGNVLPLFHTDTDKTPVLIYGAGDAGEKFYREISENPRLRYRMVGVGDDNPHK